MDLLALQQMLQDEGIQTVFDNDTLKELVFPNESYHEIEHVADGWKLNYVNRECKPHVTYECKKKVTTEEEVSMLFLVYELEKYFGKQFYHSFYRNRTKEILVEETSEYGLKRAMDVNAIPFRYISLMGYQPYMAHSVLFYLSGEKWAVSYINRSGRKINQKKTYGDYLDGMVGMLESAFKLYLYDLFAEKQRDRGNIIHLLTDAEAALLAGITTDIA